MATNFNKGKNNNSTAISDNEGFTFILQDDIEGFGLICLDEDYNRVVTIIAVYDNGVIDRFSIIIKKTDDIYLSTPIETFLEEVFDCDVEFVKTYKNGDMNIMVELETE